MTASAQLLPRASEVAGVGGGVLRAGTAGAAAADVAGHATAGVDVNVDADADAERRFGGLRRLYGDAGYARLRAGRVAVVGLGGVGSWAVEALARSGVARLVLIDLDQVAESNINRQVQALGSTVGQAKVDALRDRIVDIHPQCDVLTVDDFVSADNWPALLPAPVDVLIDACDNVRAKAALAVWGLANGVPVVCVGAAGGKRLPQRVEVDDLASTTHDPLLSALRQRLRKDHGLTRAGPIGVRCVLSREAVAAPPGDADAPGTSTPGAPLACHGYGSSVAVTATFGMVAAGEAIAVLTARATADLPTIQAKL